MLHAHAGRWEYQHQTILISLLFILIRTILLTDATSSRDYTCGHDLYSTLLQQQSEQLSAHYLQPAESLIQIRATMLGSNGMSWKHQALTAGFPVTFDQLSYYFDTDTNTSTEMLYDPNPNRWAEVFSGIYRRNFTYDDTCEYLYDPTLSWNSSCAKPLPSTVIVQYCQLNWANGCPGNLTDLLDHPIGYEVWNNGTNGYCPVYCLNPSLWNNDMIEYWFELSDPFPIAARYFLQKFDGLVQGWYWSDLHDLVRYLPSLYPFSTAAASTPEANPGAPISETAFIAQVFYSHGGPAQNPARIPWFGSPYVDFSGNSMITVSVPTYAGPNGEEYLGMMFADIYTASTTILLESTQATASPHALPFVIDPTGAIIASSQTSLDMMFCPSYCSPDINGGHFDPNTKSDGPYNATFGTVFGLQLSPFGFDQITNIVTSATFSTTQTQTVVLQLHGVYYYVKWIGIQLSNIQWYLLIAVPTFELDVAAVWSPQPSSITATQPMIDRSDSDNADELQLIQVNSYGYEYLPTSRTQPIKTFEVNNQGVADVLFSITSSVDWIRVIQTEVVVYLTSTMSAAAFDPFRNLTLPSTSGLSLSKFLLPGFGVNNLTQSELSGFTPSSHTLPGDSSIGLSFNVYVDWSKADGREDAQLLLIPIGGTNGIVTSQCFGNLLVPISIEYATVAVQYELPRGITYSVLALTILVCLALTITLALIVYYRERIVIKSSSPPFSALSLVGAILTQLCALLFVYSPDRSSNICQLRVWALPLAIILMLMPLFIKSYRIARIFNQKEMRVINLSDTKLGVVLLISLILPILLIAIHESTAPYRDQSRYASSTLGSPTNLDSPVNGLGGHGFQIQYYSYCSSSASFQAPMLSYIFVITVFGVYIAWSVRTVVHQFNESAHILTSCAFTLIYAILIIPVQFLLDDRPEALAVLRGYGITIGVIVSMGAVFGPKLFTLYLVKTPSQQAAGKKKPAQRSPDTSIDISSIMPTPTVGMSTFRNAGLGGGTPVMSQIPIKQKSAPVNLLQPLPRTNLPHTHSHPTYGHSSPSTGQPEVGTTTARATTDSNLMIHAAQTSTDATGGQVRTSGSGTEPDPSSTPTLHPHPLPLDDGSNHSSHSSGGGSGHGLSQTVGLTPPQPNRSSLNGGTNAAEQTPLSLNGPSTLSPDIERPAVHAGESSPIASADDVLRIHLEPDPQIG